MAVLEAFEPRKGNGEYVPAYVSGLVSLTGTELLQKDFPPREMILSPWCPKRA